MPSLLKKLSFFDPETGRQFVQAANGFYWKEGKKSPEDSKVTKMLAEYGWQLTSGNDVWLIFKKKGNPGELFVIRGEKRWYLDMPDDSIDETSAEGQGLDSLQKAILRGALDKPKAKAMHAGAGATAVNNAGNGHSEVDGDPLLEKRIARETMHDDSGAQTGLRNRPDYGESDSFTSEMNEANAKSAFVLVLAGTKTASGEAANLYVSEVSYQRGNPFKLSSFSFSPNEADAVRVPRHTAANVSSQILRLYGAKVKLAKPGGLLTTQNTKTQKQYSPSLVTTQNTKTQKGEEKGFLTGVMHLMPSDLAGYGDVCPCASPECRAMCLNTAGVWANAPAVQNSRRMKTELYFKNRPQFMADLRKSITSLVRKAEKNGLTPAIRINGTSDLPQVAMEMAKEFPQVQFYDYTKIPQPWKRTMPNYHITFSRSEINEQHAMEALQHGIDVAVVFNVAKGDPLPTEWKGFPVINGDKHDLRFLDRREGKGPFIVGLSGKGKARGKNKGTDSGFVVNIKPLEQSKPKDQLVQIGLPAAQAPQSEGLEDFAEVSEHKSSSASDTPHNEWFIEGCFDDAHLYV